VEDTCPPRAQPWPWAGPGVAGVCGGPQPCLGEANGGWSS
jgi:hypothetical protein